jgi:hypothetical protein
LKATIGFIPVMRQPQENESILANTTMKTKSLLPMIALAALLSLVSCQTTGSSGGPTEAVTCAKCKMVAYERVGTVNKQIAVLRTEHMTCPDCDSAIKNYFSKGIALRHTCSACGGALVHCRAH